MKLFTSCPDRDSRDMSGLAANERRFTVGAE